MYWFVLITSGMMEAVWARALSRSDGLRRLRPAAVFLLALAASLSGLGYAMLQIPAGTAYAVWVGVGASLTVVWSILVGDETATIGRLLLLIALIGGVVGLKVVS